MRVCDKMVMSRIGEEIWFEVHDEAMMLRFQLNVTEMDNLIEVAQFVTEQLRSHLLAIETGT